MFEDKNEIKFVSWRMFSRLTSSEIINLVTLLWI